MEFKNKDNLKIDEIKKLITSEYSHDKAQIICKKIIEDFFIFKDVMYELQDNKTYIARSNVKSSIINKVSLLIQLSHKQLSDTDKENIDLKFGKATKNILKNTDIETYYPHLLHGLTKENVTFNVTVREIHFNNGYMDTATKTFKQREVGIHYVTNYLQ